MDTREGIARIVAVAALAMGWASGPVARAQIEVAEELFVDLDASDPSAGTDFWENNGSIDGFIQIGQPVVEEVEGVRAVTFNAGATSDAYQCIDPTPEGLIGLDPTRSIEVWAYNPDIVSEETMVAWGKRGGPTGSNMSFNYGTNQYYSAVGHWGWDGPDLGWGTPPAAGQWHHLVYTYDGETTRVYADGMLSNSEELGAGTINTHGDGRIMLAVQNNANLSFDFGSREGTLSIARVRIHDGVLTPEQILNNFEEERDAFSVGDQPPAFLNAPFEDIVYEDVSTYTRELAVSGIPSPTLEVVQPAGATISPVGRLTYTLPDPPPDAFTVTVRATNDAGSDEATWEVFVVRAEVLAAPPVHRYSFTEDASDSIRDAHGTAYGDVTFEDGQAVLHNDGSQWSNASGMSPPAPPPGAYIDLPNGIISELDDEATFEAWVTWNGPTNSSWQRIFDFGTSGNGEDWSGGAATQYYIFLTPRSGSDTLRFGYNRGNAGAMDERNINDARLPDGTEQHVVVVWDGEVTTARMYLDGRLVDEDTATHFQLSDIPDVNNWLGRSQWNDPMFAGSFNEFRIYDYPLTPGEVLGNFVKGPDSLNTGAEGPFLVRGDADGDGRYTIGDGIQILERLFVGRPALDSDCEKTGDVDDSGVFTIGDPIRLFNYLFGGGPPPEPPAGACGEDPTPDGLSCQESTCAP